MQVVRAVRWPNGFPPDCSGSRRCESLRSQAAQETYADSAPGCAKHAEESRDRGGCDCALRRHIGADSRRWQPPRNDTAGPAPAAVVVPPAAHWSHPRPLVFRRLRAGKLTVVDATNVQQEARRPLLELARQYHCAAVAIVLNLPRYACAERNHSRPDRDFPPHVLRSQAQNLRRSLGLLASEGFHNVYFLNSPEEIHSATVQREPLACNRSFEHGPFDIIGDVHGCFEELAELLKRLGYQIGPDWQVKPPENRKAIFLGDLVDGGPNPMAVLRLVMGMVRDGFALCVPGDGDVALLRQIRDGDAEAVHALSVLLTELAREPGLRARVACLLEGLPSHYVLDGGKLVVAHAGMKE